LLIDAVAICVVPGPRAGGVAADRGKVASTHGNDDLDVGSAPRTEEDEITHPRGRVETAAAQAPGNLLNAGSGKGEVLARTSTSLKANRTVEGGAPRLEVAPTKPRNSGGVLVLIRTRAFAGTALGTRDSD